MSETFPIPFGDYQLIERLAIGGMAEIFLARPSDAADTDAPVVIKRLLPHMTADPHFNAMFVDEAKLTARLSHHNIVATHDFGRHDDQLFMVMEYVDGLDCLALLRECAHRKVRVPTEVVVYTIREVLNALDFAHNEVGDNGQPLNVVHRDISPSNVLLSRAGEVKLVDFGIARATQREHNTKDGTLKGKYGYMSPEQVVDGEIDARSDIFSVGIVMAEMLTGRRLFAAPNELDVLLLVRDARLDRLDRYGGHIGVDLNRILRKSLDKNPAGRFASAAQFSEVLSEWLYMHNHEVTPEILAQIVGSLYDDAWQRKRGSLAQAGAARAALLAEVDRQKDVLKKRAESDFRFVEVEEGDGDTPIEHIDGIPAGALHHTDSLPMLSIEVSEGSGRTSAERAESDLSQPSDGVIIQTIDGDDALSIDISDVMYAADISGDAVPVMIGEEEVVEPPADAVPIAVAANGGGDAVSGLSKYASASASADRTLPFMRPAAIASMPIIDKDHLASIEAALDSLSVPSESGRDFDDSEVSIVDSHRRSSASVKVVPGTAVVTGMDLDSAAIEDKPDDAGDFSVSSSIAVLYRLSAARATGLLVATVGGIVKEIYYREGIPEYVASNVAAELFGEYLTQQGVLSSGELSMALAVMPHFSGRLGDTLVGLGLLKPLDVFRYLTRQVRHKLIDVCTWSKGTFRWYGGREHPGEAFPLDLNSFEILGAGALALPDEIIDGWLDKLPPDCLPVAMPSPRIGPHVFQLGALMEDAYSRLDATQSVDELREHYRSRHDHDHFVRVLYLLVETGLVQLH